jgi:hypothetical protein
MLSLRSASTPRTLNLPEKAYGSSAKEGEAKRADSNMRHRICLLTII